MIRKAFKISVHPDQHGVQFHQRDGLAVGPEPAKDPVTNR
jgi:hypothetical protein